MDGEKWKKKTWEAVDLWENAAISTNSAAISTPGSAG